MGAHRGTKWPDDTISFDSLVGSPIGGLGDAAGAGWEATSGVQHAAVDVGGLPDGSVGSLCNWGGAWKVMNFGSEEEYVVFLQGIVAEPHEFD